MFSESSWLSSPSSSPSNASCLLLACDQQRSENHIPNGERHRWISKLKMKNKMKNPFKWIINWACQTECGQRKNQPRADWLQRELTSSITRKICEDPSQAPSLACGKRSLHSLSSGFHESLFSLLYSILYLRSHVWDTPWDRLKTHTDVLKDTCGTGSFHRQRKKEPWKWLLPVKWIHRTS